MRIYQCGKNVLPGIFLGYEVIAGGIWKGDILTADLEDLGNWMHEILIFDKSTRKKY